MGLLVFDHRCPFPIGWLIEGVEETPLTIGLFDDRWYTKRTILDLINRSLMIVYPTDELIFFRGVGIPPTRKY